MKYNSVFFLKQPLFQLYHNWIFFRFIWTSLTHIFKVNQKVRQKRNVILCVAINLTKSALNNKDKDSPDLIYDKNWWILAQMMKKTFDVWHRLRDEIHQSGISTIFFLENIFGSKLCLKRQTVHLVEFYYKAEKKVCWQPCKWKKEDWDSEWQCFQKIFKFRE